MNIVWSPEAVDDLTSLRAYIADDDPAAAKRGVLRIMHDVERLLPDSPQMGRAGRVPGTRELVAPGTPYRAQENTAQILRVDHGARRWPDES